MVAKFRVAWDWKSGVQQQQTAPINKEEVRDRLQMYIRSHGGYVYTYQMPIDSIKANGKSPRSPHPSFRLFPTLLSSV